MPTPAYISIEGATQGNITQGAFTEASVGNIWQEGHENEILVQAIEHRVTIPRDPQSGQPSGQRVHLPFKFTAPLNKATPLLYERQAIALSDVYEGDPHRTPLLRANDLVGYRPYADVTVLGSAHAPGGRPAASWEVSLGLGNALTDLRVHGPRRWEPEGHPGGSARPSRSRGCRWITAWRPAAGSSAIRRAAAARTTRSTRDCYTGTGARRGGRCGRRRSRRWMRR